MIPGVRFVQAFGEVRWVEADRRRRRFGVPPGGPFDRFAARLAQVLTASEAVIEVTLGPAILEAERPVRIGVVGGPNGTFALEPGERLTIQPEGCRAYVAVGESGPERRIAFCGAFGAAPIRVVRGPQADALDFDPFVTYQFTVANDSNRVGVRLTGPAQPHALSYPSEPAIPGVVQLPPGGAPIILGPDGPTMGGYPKIAVVIQADLDRIGRARAGNTLRFCEVTLEEARAAWHERQAEEDRFVRELRTGLML